MDYQTIIIAILAIAILYLLYQKVEKTERPKENRDVPYRKKQYIFTKNEYACYRNLQPIAEELGLIIYPKIRLADIVEVEKGTKEYMKWFNRISSKHIDFLMVDKDNIQIKYALELDDSSHEKESRKQRDEFVNNVCKKCGIKIIHTKNYKPEELKKLFIENYNEINK